MKRVRGYHLLFGLSLLALTSLGAWWAVFFVRSVEMERTARLNELAHAAVVTALMMGHSDTPPRPGPLPGPVPMEIFPVSERLQGEIFAPIIPRYAQFGVRPAPEQILAIDERVGRRRLMVIGEGAMMLLLLGVCSFMLYRLVRQERRHIRRMEAFVAAVTHEMKTPLTGIKSMLQTFADGRVPPAEETRLYALGLKEAERLEHMVENILISGRIRDKRLRLDAQAVELHPLLEGFVDHRRRYRIDRPEAIELVWEARDENPRVLCDPHALHLVLENLTDNAFKYGGPTPQVVLRVKAGETDLELAVEDRGIGFAPDQASDLFVPFLRAMEAPAAVQHGTGLGLSIARTLVRRMGGELTAHSEGPGKGSRFVITLREAKV